MIVLRRFYTGRGHPRRRQPYDHVDPARGTAARESLAKADERADRFTATLQEHIRDVRE